MIQTQKSYFQICCSFYSTGCSLLMMTSKKRSKYTADKKCKNKFNISICVCACLRKAFPIKIRKDHRAKKQALPGNHLVNFSSYITWDFCFFSVSCNMFVYIKDGFLFHFVFHFDYYN